MGSDIDLIKEYLGYLPDTGEFYWKKSRGRSKQGKVFLGTENKKGYLVVRFFGKPRLLHRIAFILQTGNYPEHEVDHIDGNKKNNIWSNLRDVPHQINTQNYRRKRLGFSGCQGVHWHKQCNKWNAYISVNGKSKSLGVYHDLNDAKSAREHAERFYYGQAKS